MLKKQRKFRIQHRRGKWFGVFNSVVYASVVSTVKCCHNVILNLFQDLLIYRRLRVKPAMTQYHCLTVDTTLVSCQASHKG